LRLLLDEMYPRTIAEQLSRCGHDVAAVVARPELRAVADAAVFAAAQEERRAMVTENIADFVRLARDHDAHGLQHHGLVLVDPRKFPRGSAGTIGRVVAALDALLSDRPGDEATGLLHWL
jgi:hypothetical protein